VAELGKQGLKQNLGYRLSWETITCNAEETVRQHEDVGRRIFTSREGWKWINNRYKAGGQVHVPTMFTSR
jgi:hypothetical protein